MKFVSYHRSETNSRIGLLLDDFFVIDLEKAEKAYQSESGDSELGSSFFDATFATFVRSGKRGLGLARKISDFALQKKLDHWRDSSGDFVSYNINQVNLAPPFIYPQAVMCVGANFPDHIAAGHARKEHRPISKGDIDSARKELTEGYPFGFWKSGSNIVGHEDSIPYPKAAKKLDYEGEVAIVIGEQAENVSRSDALDHILGCTLFNDLSIRGDKRDAEHILPELNWKLGKNFRGSGVLGPCIVTNDELQDIQNIHFTTKVNGELRQDGNTKDMVRSFAEIIEFLSAAMPLTPGTVIASGTPSGTASNLSSDDDPRADKYLKVGDVVEVVSESIGRIRNQII
jgi:acylpyruvate hydrolase